MIEVLFGESEAASMKAAKSEILFINSDGPTALFCAGKKTPPNKENAGWMEGNANEVICVALMLDIGELGQDICSEYRKNLIYSMFFQEQWEKNSQADNERNQTANVYIREMERLQKFIEAGEDIRIWYSKSAYSLCGLYYICSLLLHHQNKVFLVELPEYRTIENVIISYQNWGEIDADEFAFFIENQKEINRNEIKMYAQKWMDLADDNSPLRAVLNNQVIGVEEDFYDFLIWKRLKEKPVKQARLIGDILGYYRISVGDWWYAKRIQYHIEHGSIEVLADSERRYERLIKRK